jgi:hypothetical protein
VTNRKVDRHCVSKSWSRGLWLLFVLLIARSASTQDIASSDLPYKFLQSAPTSLPGGLLPFRAAGDELSGSWAPLGPVPVDQAGAGRRGYVLPVDGSDVTAQGASQFSIHTVAANNFFREQTGDFLVSQRYEAHTIALEYRRGFSLRSFPRFEIGGQVQLHESDTGMLNGFIQGFESAWATLFNNPSSINKLRLGDATLLPQGTLIARNGAALYRDGGSGSGVGDVSVTAKAAVLDGDPSSNAARLSARIGINLAGSSQFSGGNFVGAGLSLDKKLLRGVAFHGDLRATLVLDRVSMWNLPLKRMAYGFSAGPELKLSRNSSLNLQIDGSSTPYLPTGTLAFDKGYGDITFGYGHRFKVGSREVTTQLYLRENMNMPFQVRWNTDPDLAVGIKATIRSLHLRSQ